MAAESTKSVVVALITNGLIAASKFGAAAVTGSASMLSEGIHSVVDTVNQAILLYGSHRAERRPDKRHSFGYAHEVYFWALIVAVVIFGAGGGMSIVEGVTRLRIPHELGDPFWNYVVLGIAITLESISFFFALRAITAETQGIPLWRLVRDSKDAIAITVFMEDSAALAGLAIALIATYASHALNQPAIDAYGAIAIGGLLIFVALVLVTESRGLVIGESAAPETVSGVRALLASEPAVSHINRLLTMHLGPENVLLALDITFRGDLSGPEVAAVSSRLQSAFRARFPEICEVFIEAQPER